MIEIQQNITGTVFDIQRFSVNDGPGIRTTVFLKGCPLNCSWCHNPEAKTFKRQISFDMEKCKNCFACVDSCPNNVHQIRNGKHHIHFDSCNLDGSCVDSCSNEALKIIGNNSNIESVIKTILKDKSYYKNSDGGLTISGGEPLAQFQFTLELLKKAKKHNIHTAIETCGHVKSDHLIKVIPYVDLFLFDYKATGKEEHKYHTGVTNDLILKNLDLLMQYNANVILRCPLIPGINDSFLHLEGISNISKKYPKIKRIEILPYHDIGRDKAAKIGRKNFLHYLNNTPDDYIVNWLTILKKLNCNNIEISK